MEVEGQFIGIETARSNREVDLPIVTMQDLAFTTQEQRVSCRENSPNLKFEHHSQYRETARNIRRPRVILRALPR